MEADGDSVLRVVEEAGGEGEAVVVAVRGGEGAGSGGTSQGRSCTSNKCLPNPKSQSFTRHCESNKICSGFRSQ